MLQIPIIHTMKPFWGASEISLSIIHQMFWSWRVMAKATFLKYFQENLCSCLKDLINDQWEYDSLTVSTEKSNIVGTFSGFIDLCITGDRNESALVAIEIEYLSSYEQALRNIEKMKT